MKISNIIKKILIGIASFLFVGGVLFFTASNKVSSYDDPTPIQVAGFTFGLIEGGNGTYTSNGLNIHVSGFRRQNNNDGGYSAYLEPGETLTIRVTDADLKAKRISHFRGDIFFEDNQFTDVDLTITVKRGDTVIFYSDLATVTYNLDYSMLYKEKYDGSKEKMSGDFVIQIYNNHKTNPSKRIVIKTSAAEKALQFLNDQKAYVSYTKPANETYTAYFSQQTNGYNFDDRFAIGSTVYMIVSPKYGYAPDPSWTKVPNSGLYIAGSLTVAGDDSSKFGAFNLNYQKYQITYDLGGGTNNPDNPTEFTINSSAFTLKDPTRAGYTFLGWTGENIYTATKNVTFDPSTSYCSDKQYKANWKANTYTLSFDTDGGNTPSSRTVTYGGRYSGTSSNYFPDVSKSGYEFFGWYKDPEYTQKVYPDTPYDVAGDSTIYALFRKKVGYNVTSYEGTFDNQAHTISVNVTEPTENYSIKYFNNETGAYDLDAPMQFTDAGYYYVDFKITADEYATVESYGIVNIARAGVTMDIFTKTPVAKEGLIYNGENQVLIEEPELKTNFDYGDVLYRVVAEDGSINQTEYSSSLPEGKNVTTYTVYYKNSGGTNFKSVEEQSLTVTINEVDKEEISNLFNYVSNYVNEIYEEHTNVASNLKAIAGNIRSVAIDEKNVTEEFVNNKRDELQDALDHAKADVTEELIDKIGEVNYNQDSKGLIDAARNYYNNLDNDKQKELVENLAVLEAAEALYNAVDNFVNKVNALPAPTDTDSYHNALEDAKNTLKDLTPEQRAILPDEYVEKLNDHIEASKVVDAISNIGQIEYNQDSKDKIDDARNQYEALTEEQKALVTNIDDLIKDESDYEAVDNSANLITILPNPTSSEEYHNKLDDAKAKYDHLTDDQKKVLPKHYVDSLDNHLAASDVVDLIANIGEVEYTFESEEKLAIAREYYDSLTDEHKALVGELHKKQLQDSEKHYDKLNKGGITFLIIFYVLSVAAIVYGGYVMKKLINKKVGTKVMSVAPITLLLTSTSKFTATAFIILYVLIGIAALVWITNLVIYLTKKRGIDLPKIIAEFFKNCFKKVVKLFKKEKVVEKTEERIEEAKDSPQEDEEVEEVIHVVENGVRFIIRYNKSFLAKLIQSSDEAKRYYQELKNEALSYKKAKSRISWSFDSINVGREYLVKFGVRGKTICVYLPLDPDSLDEKYKVERMEAKKYEGVPCLYRIKNDRRCKYAKELFALIAERLGLEKGEVPTSTYYLPYEERKPLIERGLIKVIKIKEDVEPEEEVRIVEENGIKFKIRYNKSFLAKYIQSRDETKAYYQILKNYVLSYKKTSSRISWHYDSINVGKNKVLKFAVRGKTLCLYLALNPEELDDKYKVEKAESKRYEDVPCLYRIKNDRRCKYAKELIDIIMRKLNNDRGKEQNEDYYLPYETTDALLQRELIKEYKTKVDMVEHFESISAEEVDSKMSDEVASSLVEEDRDSQKHVGKKAVINIDVLSENFSEDEEINIEKLWEKKLVSKQVGYVKVLARGTLNKALHIDLQDYSIQAVKMILLVGGSVKKAK